MRKDLTSVLIPFVYFIAGATSLAGVAGMFYYKDDLGLSVVQTQVLAGLAIIPWSIKPIYGFLSDSVPIFSMRRRPYLFLAGILGSAGYFSLATWVWNFWGAVACALVSQAGFALADVIVDGIVAERSRTLAVAGKLQSLCRTAQLLGGLVVAYASGILVELVGARNVFFVTGFLPLLTTAFSLFLAESTTASVQIHLWRDFVALLRRAMQPAILWSVAFLFVWRSTPTSGAAFSFFLIDELHFTPEFFGRLSFVSSTMAIIGVLFFRKFLVSVSLKKLFFWTIIASVVLSLPTLGLIYGWYRLLGVSPQFFAMADTFVTASLSEIAYLPLLVLVARICPRGVEATMFALIASIMNIGLSVSDMGGAALSSFFGVDQGSYANLDKVMWIAILSSLLPLPLIPFLPETRAAEERLPQGAEVVGRPKEVKRPLPVGREEVA